MYIYIYVFMCIFIFFLATQGKIGLTGPSEGRWYARCLYRIKIKREEREPAPS